MQCVCVCDLCGVFAPRRNIANNWSGVCNIVSFDEWYFPHITTIRTHTQNRLARFPHERNRRIGRNGHDGIHPVGGEGCCVGHPQGDEDRGGHARERGGGTPVNVRRSLKDDDDDDDESMLPFPGVCKAGCREEKLNGSHS